MNTSEHRDRALALAPTAGGPTLTERAGNALAGVRAEFPFETPGRQAVVIESTRARWCAWAGRQANATLRRAVGDPDTRDRPSDPD